LANREREEERLRLSGPPCILPPVAPAGEGAATSHSSLKNPERISEKGVYRLPRRRVIVSSHDRSRPRGPGRVHVDRYSRTQDLSTRQYDLKEVLGPTCDIMGRNDPEGETCSQCGYQKPVYQRDISGEPICRECHDHRAERRRRANYVAKTVGCNPIEADALIRRARNNGYDYDVVDWDTLQGKDLQFDERIGKLEHMVGRTYLEGEYEQVIKAEEERWNDLMAERSREIDRAETRRPYYIPEEYERPPEAWARSISRS